MQNANAESSANAGVLQVTMEEIKIQRPDAAIASCSEIWITVIGGVCSGPAAYCKMDPVIMRLIFFCCGFCFGFNWQTFFCGLADTALMDTFWRPCFFSLYNSLDYKCLGQKTVEDKCAMKGSALGVQGVEYDYNNSNGTKRGRVWKNHKIIVGIVCILALEDL